MAVKIAKKVAKITANKNKNEITSRIKSCYIFNFVFPSI